LAKKKLKVTEMDDDVKTDDEQLQLAKKHIQKQLNEAINSYKRSKKVVKNSYSF